MVDFFNFRVVTAAKQHVCEQCRKPILKGERHQYCAMNFDGDFSAYREHFECRAAWSELNFELRGMDHYEGAPFLADDDSHEREDKDWMRETHPLVAERLGWLPAASSALHSAGVGGR